MADSLVVRVAPGLTGWAASDHDIYLEAGHDHRLSNPSKGLVSQVAAAIAAGSLELVKGRIDTSAVQPDKQSLKVRNKAEKAVLDSGLHEKRDKELLEADSSTHDKIVERYEQAMAEVAQGAVE